MGAVYRSKWNRPEWGYAFEDDEGLVHAAKKLDKVDAAMLGHDDDLLDCTYYARCDNDLFLYDRSKGAVNCMECIAEEEPCECC